VKRKSATAKERNRKRPWAHYLAMWGCFCTGVVYTGIGVVAILSFFRVKQGGADEASLMVYLNKFVLGQIFIWLVLSGMLSYIVWRIYETIKDPYGYGTEAKGTAKRAAIAFSSLADAFIASSAIQALLGKGGAVETGQPTAERDMASRLLQESWGAWLLIITGVVTLLTAVIQMVYVISAAYKERLDIDFLSQWKQTTVHVLAWAGHFARGIILGIIGFFLIKAGVAENGQYVVNTDKAFDFIGDDVGHFWFLLVAAGTICYGIFMFALGTWYDSDKD
jgi:hypothetical protein